MKYPNAKIWANHNLGVFFRGYPASLTGQCVSLVKWFLQDMTSVPNPQAPRGNAKDFGDTLVAQGHAKKRRFAYNRRRGDIVVWKQDGGGYGHIGVLTDKDHVFEENVGIAGSKSKIVSGQRVYASRIDRVDTPWRVGKPTYYVVKSYKEAEAYVLKYDKSNFRKNHTTASKITRTKNKGYTVYVRKFANGQTIRGSNKWAQVWKKDYIHSSLIKKG